jgi:hypothetical protein
MTVRRCRVCTVVINADVPENGPAVEEPVARPALDDHFDAAVIDRQMQSARSKFGGGSGALSARLAAANGGALPDSYAIAPDEPTPETFDPFSSQELSSQELSSPQPPPDPGSAAPVAHDDERFDPDALFRDIG